MKKNERINVLIKLGERLALFDEKLKAVIHGAYLKNPWFTEENTTKAIEAIVSNMLQINLLEEWTSSYALAEETSPKKVGIIMAGNIPLVGFHDLLCVFIAGHHAKIKLSDKDPYLLPYLIEILNELDPNTNPYFEVIERIKDIDGIIATGSNNTARYFEAYFGKYPNIIRKNRNAIAVLDGTETKEQLEALATDVFQYFGLGCRNVSKMYLPKGYSFNPLLEALHTFNHLQHHNKYKNNFDYNYTLLILNGISYQANGCILMTEDKAIPSRIASLHYEYYEPADDLEKELLSRLEEIQCVVSKMPFESLQTVDFGEAQQPGLANYADGVDTLEFLTRLSEEA